MFISFEGIDGCGKTTHIRKLNAWFLARGYETILLREPGGTDFSESIREMLLNSKSDITNISELLLFSAARAHLVEKIIKPALENNQIVITDRFADSTFAYQGFGRGIELEAVETCIRLATSEIKPDLTIFLNLPIEIARARSSSREADRMEQLGDDFYKKVIQGYLYIAERETDRFKIVSSSGSSDETFNAIINIVTNKFTL